MWGATRVNRLLTMRSVAIVFVVGVLLFSNFDDASGSRAVRRRYAWRPGRLRQPINRFVPQDEPRLTPTQFYIRNYDGGYSYRRLRYKRSPAPQSEFLNPFQPNSFNDHEKRDANEMKKGTGGPAHDDPSFYDLRYGPPSKAVVDVEKEDLRGRDKSDSKVSSNREHREEKKPNYPRWFSRALAAAFERYSPNHLRAYEKSAGELDTETEWRGPVPERLGRALSEKSSSSSSESLESDEDSSFWSNESSEESREEKNIVRRSTGGGFEDGDDVYLLESGRQDNVRFVHHVVDVRHHQGGSTDPNEAWKVDCNGGRFFDYKYGFINGIWDDGDDFTDLDKVKCTGSKDRRHGYKLDLEDQRRIDLTPEHNNYTPICPRGYVLTGVWDDHYGFEHIMYGKCARVVHGSVDNGHCNNFYTRYKDHGPSDAGTKWLVQCPREWAAIGVRRDCRRIDHLRCCRLIPASRTDF